MEALQTLIFMSLVVEVIVAVFKKLVTDRSTQVVSVFIGITLCMSYEVGIFQSLGLESSFPWIDYVLSGIVISRGSNALSDLFSFTAKKGKGVPK